MDISKVLQDMQQQISDLEYQLNGVRKIESHGNYLTSTLGVGVMVKRDSSQSIGTGSWQTVDWTSIVWESLPTGITSQWSSGTSGRITCQIAGLYVVSSSIRFAVNTTGIRGMTIQKNTVSQGASVQLATSTLDAQLSSSVIAQMAVGEYIQVLVYQNVGSALNINYGSNGIILEMAKIG